MSRPWMPLYVADFLADTMHLNAAQTGAYLLLIMHYWQHECLPDDDCKLSRIARMRIEDWRRHRGTIEPFFQPGWRHARIDSELHRSSELSNKRKHAAKQKHSNCRAFAPPIAEHLQTHARALSQSQPQEMEDSTANAVPSKYAFEDGVIRLNQKDFDSWKRAFSNLDLAAELLSLSKWAESEGKNWFHAVKGALAKRNREVKVKKDALIDQGGFKWNGNIEGVI
jgi:uncharacterized protein YdaU (DUF1376 family)